LNVKHLANPDVATGIPWQVGTAEPCQANRDGIAVALSLDVSRRRRFGVREPCSRFRPGSHASGQCGAHHTLDAPLISLCARVECGAKGSCRRPGYMGGTNVDIIIRRAWLGYRKRQHGCRTPRFGCAERRLRDGNVQTPCHGMAVATSRTPQRFPGSIGTQGAVGVGARPDSADSTEGSADSTSLCLPNEQIPSAASFVPWCLRGNILQKTRGTYRQ